MSVKSIRKALEVALSTLSPAMPTAWQNVHFLPTNNVAYQAAHVLLAKPDNPTMGDRFRREQGIFQIDLKYPQGAGSADIETRAEMLKTLFARGSCFIQDGVAVTIEGTPEVSPGRADGDRWVVPVKVRFYANIST